MAGNGWEAAIEYKRDMGHCLAMRMLPALLLLGACQHMSAGVGPNPDEFVAAILNAPEVAGPTRLSTSELRSLGCRRFDEEPTEFLCRFESRDATGAWRKRSAIVATDADRWVLLSLN
ncbi:hypothetical protein E2E27_12770 [Porphyrobacter sp. YT40]|nr:hypothetical protein E2E27_12770 [Porphyrobacter sp. YT40]